MHEQQVAHQILAWSRSLPLWQRDALRRIAVKGGLTAADIGQLTLMCKAEAGLPLEADRCPTPQPLEMSHLRLPDGPGQGAVSITAIADVQNVNALKNGQTLRLRPTELNVVYGPNGAGKSGWFRVLAQACSGRQREPDLLPNMLIRGGEAAIPSAQVEYTSDSGSGVLHWHPGARPCATLQSVVVLDWRQAAAYFASSGATIFLPGPLRMLRHLASACDAVRDAMSRELKARRASRSGALRHRVREGTAVWNVLDDLAADGARERTEELAAYGVAQRARLGALRSALDGTNTAHACAELLRRVTTRLRAVARHLQTIDEQLGDDACKALLGARRRADEARAALSASLSAFSAEPLRGVGTPAWRAMWDAAKSIPLKG